MRVPVTATVKEIGRNWSGGNRGHWRYFINLTNVVANDQPIPDQYFGQGMWSSGLQEGQTVHFYASLDRQSLSFPTLSGPLTKDEVNARRRKDRADKKKLLETFSEDDIQLLMGCRIAAAGGYGYYSLAGLVTLSVDELTAMLNERKEEERKLEENRLRNEKQHEEWRKERESREKVAQEHKERLAKLCDEHLDVLVGKYRPSQIHTNHFTREATWPEDRIERLAIVMNAINHSSDNITRRLEQLGLIPTTQVAA